jgi:two-component system response regulator AtoC
MSPSETTNNVILGEDDLEVSGYLETALTCQGYSVTVAREGDEVLSAFRTSQYPTAAILLDMVMPGRNGMDTLREIRRLDPAVPVIMISAASSPLVVVEAMRLGATDFLSKPLDHDRLCRSLDGAITGRQAGVPDRKPSAPAALPGRDAFLGISPSMLEIQALLDRVAYSHASVLIEGETGVGKEVIAREIHARSARAQKRFVKLNCAAVPSELVESELFGYEKGAFTGAFQRKPGIFELTDGGTILLDEIGDMEFKLQSKLLQVLQDHEFQRLGGRETIRVDVRVLAATHRDLERAMEVGQFRQDLYYRLSVVNFKIPSLRERREDILPLVERLMRRHEASGTPVPLPSELKQAFMSYSWPGNVRELENVIRKFLILKDTDLIIRDLDRRSSREMGGSNNHAILSGGDAAPTAILDQVTRAKDHAEKTAIVAALNSTQWNRKKAAILLKIEYKALLYKMKKLNIEDKMAVLTSASEEEESGPLKLMTAGGH